MSAPRRDHKHRWCAIPDGTLFPDVVECSRCGVRYKLPSPRRSIREFAKSLRRQFREQQHDSATNVKLNKKGRAP